MPSEAVNQQTRHEWRELGFFYDRDEARHEWLLRGSAAGIRAFCTLLREYGADPRHSKISEHDYFGPYMYLEFMTSEEAEISGHAICGRPADFRTLAAIVEGRLAQAHPGDAFEVGSDYSPESPYVLRFRVEADGFDPAAADPSCWGDVVPQTTGTPE